MVRVDMNLPVLNLKDQEAVMTCIFRSFLSSRNPPTLLLVSTRVV